MRWDKIRVVFSLVAFLLICPGWAAADLLAHFTVVITKSEEGKGENSDIQIASPLFLRFAEKYIEYRLADQEYILDFATRKQYILDPQNKAYKEVPLYALLAFRVKEIQNRIFFRQTIARNNPDNWLFLLFDEHQFSVITEQTIPRMTMQETPEMTVYLADSQPILTVSKDRIALKAQYQTAFIRFFRYHYGGHPWIIGNIATAAGLAKEITIALSKTGQNDQQSTNITLKLQALYEVPPKIISFSGLHKQENVGNALSRLATHARQTKQTREELILADILTKSYQAIQNKQEEEFWFSFMEYFLITGDAQFPWPEQTELDQRKKQEQGLQKMITFLSSSQSEEQAQESIRQLQEWQESYPAYVHVLKILEANSQKEIGQSERAKKLMLDGLAANPLMISAWVDLGGIFYSQNQTINAWFCWNLARELAPDHPILQIVADLEDRLAKDLAYFLPPPY